MVFTALNLSYFIFNLRIFPIFVTKNTDILFFNLYLRHLNLKAISNLMKNSFIFLLLVFLNACNPPDIGSTKFVENKFQNVNSSKFLELIQKGNGIILDVRTLAEAQQGHIPNAIVIDIYQKDFEEKIKALPKDSEIYIYCTVGARSKQAAMIMQKNGFEKVFNLEAGIMDWARNRYPITQ